VYQRLATLREELLNLDYAEVAARIESFIGDYVKRACAEGVVVGLSGGVDSSVTATLCVRALGGERVLGLIMPAGFTPQQDLQDAEWLARWLGISYKTISIDPLVETYAQRLGYKSDDPTLRIVFANLRARIRMSLLYFHANSQNLLVAGTGDRSEAIIGYFTKFGDGGVDFLPLGSLFKTQVRRLAAYLGLPDRIAYKPSSPQLYPGHRAIDEIPLDYDDLDVVLYLLFDRGKTPEEANAETGVPLETINDILARYQATKHKRETPPVAPLFV